MVGEGEGQRTAAEIEAELDGLDFQPAEGAAEGGEVEAAAALEAELAEAESQASRQGWVPKDKYKGDPKKWVDAKTFIERGERFTSNLQQEIAALRAEVEGFKGTKAAFVKFHEETIARKDAELKEAIAAARIQRSAAQQDGEHETVVALEDRIELLKEQQKELKAPIEKPAEEPAAKPGLDMNNPVLVEWIEEENQWFRDEPKLRDYAIAVGEDLIKNGETVRGRPFLDKVAEIMRRDFPRRFKPQTSETGEMGSAVGSANQSGGKGGAGGKTERDLPPEDQALMRQFIKEGWTTKEKFLASYFSKA
jgi:hypothetical protein